MSLWGLGRDVEYSTGALVYSCVASFNEHGYCGIFCSPACCVGDFVSGWACGCLQFLGFLAHFA